jgi:hypothetical protein
LHQGSRQSFSKVVAETFFLKLWKYESKNYLKYLQYFSLITVTSEKIPNHKWKEQQTKRLSPEEFQRHLENPTTDNVGIVTGFEDLEVLDIDLKVFSTTSEKIIFGMNIYQF